MPASSASARFDVLVLIASAHTLEATSPVLAELSPGLPVAVLIAPAREGREVESELENVRRLSLLPIHAAGHGTVLEPGCVYVTPLHRVLEVRPGLRCTLTSQDDLPSPRPLDQLLVSLALSAGPRALVVVLGGQGEDGVDGARALRGVGGTVLVQRPDQDAEAELPRGLAQAATLTLSSGNLGRVVADLLGTGSPSLDPAITEQTGMQSAVREHRSAGVLAGMNGGFYYARALFDEGGRCMDLLCLDENPAAIRMTGQSARGRRMSELALHEQFWRDLLGHTARTGEPWRRVRSAADDLWYDLSVFKPAGAGPDEFAVVFHDAAPYMQAEQGVGETREPTGEGGVALSWRDVTGRVQAEETLRASEERQGFLLGLSDILQRLSAPNDIKTAAMHMLGRQLGVSRAQYHEVDESGEYYSADGTGYADGLPLLDLNYRIAQFGRFVAEDFGAGRPFRSDDLLTDPRPSDEERAAYSFYGIRAGAGIPLLRGGRLVAILAVHDLRPHPWTDLEMDLIRETAERVWVAVEKVRAEQAVRESEERQAFLLRFSDALRTQPDEPAIKNLTVQMLAAHLRLDRCYVSEVFGGQGFSTVGPEYRRPDLTPMSGVFRLSEYPETMRRLATQPMVVRDVGSDQRFSAAEQALLAGLQMQALLVVALREGPQAVVWALAAAMTTPRQWTDGERTLLEDVAERTWAAVERARAEATLAASEEKYRTLFDSIDEGLAIVEMIPDERGEIVDMVYRQVNAAYEAQGGVSNVVGRSIFDVIPGVEDVWLDRYRQVARTGVPLRVEDYQQDVGRWFEVYFSRLGHDGRFVAIVFNDVSVRRRAQAELRAREERQAFLLKLSDALRAEPDEDAAAHRALELLCEQLDLDRCYVATYRLEEDRADFTHQVGNGRVPPLPGGIRLSDFPEALRVTLDRTLVIDDVAGAAGLSDLDRQNMSGLGMGALVAATLRRGEGRPLWCIVTVSAGARHWTPGEVALLEEATERTWVAMERARTEAARRASEARFRAVANLVPDLLWESRPDGFTSWYNQRWLDYTGQTLEQATGWGWADAIHPEDREGSAQGYMLAMHTGQPLRQEHRIRRHDGDYRWFVVNTFAHRDERAEVVRIYGAATDIHHLRVRSALLEAHVEDRTRRLAEANTELQSRTRALEAFAELTRSLAPHLDPYALIRQGQEVALSLLPEGFATYYEPGGARWHLKAQSGDMHHPALQAAADAGLDLGRTPSLDQPWAQGAPLFQGHYGPDTDGLGALEHGARAVATLPLSVGGRRVGVFAVALFARREWSGADRAMLETVVRNLGLALERSAAVRALAEEREALAAFAHFTERAAEVQDTPTLARRATDVLQQVLAPGSAVYFEREGDLWRQRCAAGQQEPELEAALQRGVPANLPGFALAAGQHEPGFFEHWDPGERFPAAPMRFRAVAAYPLFPQDHPAGLLSMALTDRPTWTEREKAVFRAVGDSFRLALERTAQLLQIERQRERLADLNAELGNLITRTAHNLEVPAQRLGQLLNPGPASGPPALDGLPPYDPALLQDEVARLKGVAEDLRQLSGLEAHELNWELLALGELFAQVRGATRAGTGGQVAWQLQPLPIVRGDRALLLQALGVLATFTLSATRGARYVTVDSFAVGGEVQVVVEDDGVGLSAEEAATLFDLVVRTDQGVPVLEGGGLIQVRRILARHGGWAWAEPRGSGGKVVLAFPQDAAVGELEALFRSELP
ncbi:GAF domain-containing protein [Deinococcus petrolearius]|uniref:histidine kinase n=1 Tax=Deinococcus petrolearius TaxID=1751295 RepID=A0ABW1DM15_9DEIO